MRKIVNKSGSFNKVNLNNPYCQIAKKIPQKLCKCGNCSEYRAEAELIAYFDRIRDVVENNGELQ